MTRDEAIAKTKAAMHHPNGVIWCSSIQEVNGAIARIEASAAEFVDASVALGMLKLDESKIDFNPYEGARCIFRNRFGDQIAADLLAAFHASGLAIVDAQLGKRRS